MDLICEGFKKRVNNVVKMTHPFCVRDLYIMHTIYSPNLSGLWIRESFVISTAPKNHLLGSHKRRIQEKGEVCGKDG